MDNQPIETGVTGKYTTSGVPHGYSTITPFIVVSNPTEAIAFYEAVFGANTKNVTDIGEEGKPNIIHADIDFGNGYLQLGTANPTYGLVMPPGEGNACYSLAIYVTDVDQILAKAISHGATVREPVANFVSGDRFCSILDPYGIRWTIMTRIEDISEEESYRRVSEWSKNM